MLTVEPLATTIVIVAATVLAVVASVRLQGRNRYVTVWEWEHGLLFRNGRFERELPPGRYQSGLFGRAVVAVSMRPRQLVVPAQDLLTADGFPVKLGGVLDWRVADARRHYAATAGLTGSAASGQDALYIAVQLALRAAGGTRTLDALLAARADAGALEAEMLPAVAAAADAVGAIAERLSLRDLILPAEVRRMVTEVERARREGLAALERARGEQAALRSLANAARLMRDNPALQSLRTLQALTPVPGRAAPTLVLGVPAMTPLPAASPAGPQMTGEDAAET